MKSLTPSCQVLLPTLKCMQLAQGLCDFKLVKVKKDLFLKVKTRLN